MSVVHVDASAVVPYDATRAGARLTTLLGVGEPGIGTPQRALRARVGPRRPAWARRTVQGVVEADHTTAGSRVFPLSWRPAGRLHNAFPALRGALVVTPIDDTSSLLTFAGDYQPPLGRVGRSIDAAALSRIGTSTAAAFVADVRDALRHVDVRALA